MADVRNECKINIVRMLILCVLCISLSLSAFATMFDGATVSITATEKCCLRTEENGCGKQMPKSGQERQCCQTCSIGLNLFLVHKRDLVPPAPREHQFAEYILKGPSVSFRPPVPPPRIALAIG
jgi:hypothetical protein